MHLIFITNKPEMAKFAVASGVDYVMVDLESLGKSDRQGHLDTLVSAHTIADVQAVRRHVPPGRLLVRSNPLNADTARELDDIISSGADWVMQPYFHSADEVTSFSEILSGRAKLILLAETRGAMLNLEKCCEVSGVDRVHIGLNDLSLELGKNFMFELLVDGTVEKMSRILRDNNVPFGVGGVARIGEGMVSAEKILAVHAHLGSSAAILSRTFHRQSNSVEMIESEMDFAAEVRKIREAFNQAGTNQPGSWAEKRKNITRAITEIARTMPDRRKPDASGGTRPNQ